MGPKIVLVDHNDIVIRKPEYLSHPPAKLARPKHPHLAIKKPSALFPRIHNRSHDALPRPPAVLARPRHGLDITSRENHPLEEVIPDSGLPGPNKIFKFHGQAEEKQRWRGEAAAYRLEKARSGGGAKSQHSEHGVVGSRREGRRKISVPVERVPVPGDETLEGFKQRARAWSLALRIPKPGGKSKIKSKAKSKVKTTGDRKVPRQEARPWHHRLSHPITHARDRDRDRRQDPKTDSTRKSFR